MQHTPIGHDVALAFLAAPAAFFGGVLSVGPASNGPSAALVLAGGEEGDQLDQARELDLRSPYQDFFDPIWRQGWRAGDLLDIGSGEEARRRFPEHHTQPRPERAIVARRRAAASKVAAVEKAIRALGRTWAPLTRMVVARLAGVSRSFTYENDAANRMIAAAQARSQARAEDRIDTRTLQQEASWRERALNAEDEIRNLRRELATQRQLVGDLLGQLREPDGTW